MGAWAFCDVPQLLTCVTAHHTRELVSEQVPTLDDCTVLTWHQVDESYELYRVLYCCGLSVFVVPAIDCVKPTPQAKLAA